MLLIYISAIYKLYQPHIFNLFLHTSRFDLFEDDFWYVLEFGRITHIIGQNTMLVIYST